MNNCNTLKTLDLGKHLAQRNRSKNCQPRTFTYEVIDIILTTGHQ